MHPYGGREFNKQVPSITMCKSAGDLEWGKMRSAYGATVVCTNGTYNQSWTPDE
jgi:hypothetical protein